MKKAEPKYVAETLAWCNARRKEQGKRALKRLPKGETHNGVSCPCGKATNLYVGAYDYWKLPIECVEQTSGKLPRPVQEFIVAFDKGKLPQYEE